MTLFGGVGTLFGPFSIVVTLQNYLFNFPLSEWVHVIVGLNFVICVLLFRLGIVGWVFKLARRTL
ncbi:ABC-type branched-subunit amino acid transport system permease subunit [Pseudomonas frederiksbergensis]